MKIGKTICEEITTNIGIPQGDCLRPILFVIYLAEAMKNLKQIITPNNTLDHNYCHQFQKLSIYQQCVDDIGWASRDKNEIQKLSKEAPTGRGPLKCIFNMQKCYWYVDL